MPHGGALVWLFCGFFPTKALDKLRDLVLHFKGYFIIYVRRRGYFPSAMKTIGGDQNVKGEKHRAYEKALVWLYVR